MTMTVAIKDTDLLLRLIEGASEAALEVIAETAKRERLWLLPSGETGGEAARRLVILYLSKRPETLGC